MTQDPSSRFDVWLLFLRTHAQVLEKLKKEMRKEHDLPLTWFDVMAQLRIAGGRMRMTELAESVLLSTSGLTRLLDRMEKKELIKRESCLDDRRGFWAILTEEGLLLAQEVWISHSEGVRRHFLDHLGSRGDPMPNRCFHKNPQR